MEAQDASRAVRVEAYKDDSADPPVLEELGLAEVEHNQRDNRMRAR